MSNQKLPIPKEMSKEDQERGILVVLKAKELGLIINLAQPLPTAISQEIKIVINEILESL